MWVITKQFEVLTTDEICAMLPVALTQALPETITEQVWGSKVWSRTPQPDGVDGRRADGQNNP
jgi:hypothetical protein